MRFYQYKELLKIYALNYKKEDFSDTRNSMYCFLVIPGLTSLFFNLVNPYSIFRKILIYSAFGATTGCFWVSVKEELPILAKKDDSEVGD